MSSFSNLTAGRTKGRVVAGMVQIRVRREPLLKIETLTPQTTHSALVDLQWVIAVTKEALKIRIIVNKFPL